ncbi:transglutaminase domain-containing protein [Salinithrix halophila]|uniref:Transglutaminase domain-containing protein n=1 Tax=Salinithrix halophila TaxID=1485204 RepID=A0ABV8J9X5_9BACL
MNRRIGMWGALMTALSLVVLAGCGLLADFETEAKQKLGKYDALAEKKNEELDLRELKLEPYADEVGGRLSSPRYQEFAVNSQLEIKGSAKKYRGFRSDVAWIEVEKESDGGKEMEFSYYAPLRDGRFSQRVQLFDGKGKYQVTVRLPGKDEEDRFYDLARFEVINVNPEKKRDVALTRAGQAAGLKIDRPTSGLTQAKGVFNLEGSLGKIENGRVMVRLEKDGKQWEHLFPLEQGKFVGKIPLFYGKGVHQLTLLTPDKKRKDYYNEAGSLLVENTADRKRNPIEYFKHYDERGVKLASPLAGGDSANMKYRIKGRINPDAPYADQTKHLIVQTKKDGMEATYFVPVKNYRFDDTFWLRFGKGEYEVTVNVPEITDEQRDYFRFFGVARFTVTNTSDRDLRNLLPSRGIQSKDETIRALAEELTQGKKGDQAKALAVYEYVAKNIRYDVQKFKNDEFEYDDSARKTLKEKEGVCQDYSFLAIALLRSIDIETRFVQGVADGNRHAWVEVKVDGRWLTMDPTWGSGYIDGNDRFVRRYTTKYFDPKPGEFAKTHTRTGVMY